MPEALARYNAKHNKWIDKAEKVLTLQKLYKWGNRPSH